MNKTDTTSRARLIPKTCIQRCCWCSYLGTPCHPSQWRSTVWCLGSSVCFSLGGFRQNHDASIHRESSLAHPQTWLALLRSLFNLFLCRLILRKLINWSPNRSLAWAAVCVCDNYQWDDSEARGWHCGVHCSPLCSRHYLGHSTANSLHSIWQPCQAGPAFLCNNTKKFCYSHQACAVH